MKKYFFNGNRIIRAAILMLISAAALSMTACGRQGEAPEQVKQLSEENTSPFVYYLNFEGTRIDRVDIDSHLTGVEDEDIEIILGALSMDPQSSELKRNLGIDVTLLGYQVVGEQLSLNFADNYNNLSRSDEVLFRAAIVRSMCQIEGVDSVIFLVEDEPIADSTGTPIGGMMAENFVDNPGDEINAYERAEIVLYFANAQGTALVPEHRNVVYSSNISMEKLIMEELLKGPEDEKLSATLSSDRKINSVTVKDGTCYVDLSEPAVDFTGAVSEEASIYSIVNSLSEIEGVNRVQITVDGAADRTLRGGISLDQVFERSLDIIEGEE